MSMGKKTRWPIYQRLIDVNAQVKNIRNVYFHYQLSVSGGKTTDLLYCRSVDRYLISYRPILGLYKC